MELTTKITERQAMFGAVTTNVWTWTVAQYDRKRDRKIDQTERMVEEMRNRIRSLEKIKKS
mgnify:CR=1 FL=1